tara:strand:+ start:1834 stop:1953 length:120 start_codon:yes stop_codon:yes gene_type:complete
MTVVYDCKRCGRHYERETPVIVNAITCCGVASTWKEVKE